MDIEINKKTFEDALLWVNRFLVNTNVAEDALTSIKIATITDNSIMISAANIETYTECTKECHINKEGEAIVNGKSLLEIVKLMPEEAALHFYTSTDDGKFHIEAKKSKHSIPIVRTEIIKQKFDDAAEVATIKVESFIKLLDQVSIAVAKDDATPILTTVHFEIEKNKMQATTIDRYRVARKVIDIKTTTSENVVFNAKYKNLSTIVNGLEKGDDISFLTTPDNHKYAVISGDKKAISVTVAADFPETNQLFDAEYSATVDLDRDAFKEVINRASVLTDPSHGIMFNLEKGQILVSSNEDSVSANEVLECKYDGSEIAFKFNPLYIKEGISKMDYSDLRLKISESTKPVEFIGTEKDKECEEYRYIVVPIRNV